MDMSASGSDFATDGFVDNLNSGYVLFHTSGDAEVANCQMSAAAFGDSASGTAVMSTASTVQDTNTTSGTVAHAHLVTSASAIMAQLECGITPSGELQFSSLAFDNGETLIVSSLSVSWVPTAIT